MPIPVPPRNSQTVSFRSPQVASHCAVILRRSQAQMPVIWRVVEGDLFPPFTFGTHKTTSFYTILQMWLNEGCCINSLPIHEPTCTTRCIITPRLRLCNPESPLMNPTLALAPR
jgi:hypothetical protein